MRLSSSASVVGLAMVLVVFLGGWVPPASAQDVVVLEEDEPEEAEEKEDLGVDWPDRIRAIDQDLQLGSWMRAGASAAELGDEMAAILTEQRGADYALATVAAYEALAAAGQGHRDEARWLWLTALNLWDDYEGSDLSAYGRAGEVLDGVRLRENRDDLQRPQSEGEVQTIADVDRPPMRTAGEPPLYPASLQVRGVEGLVLVEAVVDSDGRLREPLVVESEGPPAFVYSALRTLSAWRFDPARLDGEPVAVFQLFRFVFELEE